MSVQDLCLFRYLETELCVGKSAIYKIERMLWYRTASTFHVGREISHFGFVYRPETIKGQKFHVTALLYTKKYLKDYHRYKIDK